MQPKIQEINRLIDVIATSRVKLDPPPVTPFLDAWEEGIHHHLDLITCAMLESLDELEKLREFNVRFALSSARRQEREKTK